jgi:hypothetical protein
LAAWSAGLIVFKVLAPRPKTEKTGEVTQGPDGEQIKWHRIASWPELGTAKSYEEARRKFGGRPVLEYIGKVH